MTLVLSLRGRDTLWLVVDRRLSYGSHRPAVDTAVKVMHLETTDGVGLLGYAGLGATARGTQPSEWMSAVLRGRGGLTFEQALGVLSEVANKELPGHLAGLPGGAHFIIVPAFIRGIGFRLYSIDYVIDGKTGKHWYRYTSHQPTVQRGLPRGQITLAGTGGIYLDSKGQYWRRPLRRLVKAHDQEKVSDHLIADQLARLNYEAHQEVRDGTVGPRCIVVWRRRPDARSGRSGGGHQFYTGTDRDDESNPVPTIVNGGDVAGLVNELWSMMQAQLGSRGPGATFDFDQDEMNRRLAELPDAPDEKLR